MSQFLALNLWFSESHKENGNTVFGVMIVILPLANLIRRTATNGSSSGSSLHFLESHKENGNSLVSVPMKILCPESHKENGN